MRKMYDHSELQLSQYQFGPRAAEIAALPDIYVPPRGKTSILEQLAIALSVVAMMLCILYVNAPNQLFAMADTIGGAMRYWTATHQEMFVSDILRKHGRKREGAQRLARLIVQESKLANYDPLFVAAVIKSESAFNPEAVSPRGAIGLMQIMPETGRFIMGASKSEWRKERLKDPALNVRLGIAYLKYLESKFGPVKHHILIAYNWGPANLSRILKGKSSAIPKETARYSTAVRKDHERWQRDYRAQLYFGSFWRG